MTLLDTPFSFIYQHTDFTRNVVRTVVTFVYARISIVHTTTAVTGLQRLGQMAKKKEFKSLKYNLGTCFVTAN